MNQHFTYFRWCSLMPALGGTEDDRVDERGTEFRCAHRPIVTDTRLRSTKT